MNNLPFNKPTLKKLQKNIRNHIKDIRSLLDSTHSEKTAVLNVVMPLLREVFGYPAEWIDTEAKVNGKRIDIAITPTEKPTILICECKRYTGRNKFTANSQVQLKNYCMEKNCEWGILTNGVLWQLWYCNLKNGLLEKVYEVSFENLLSSNITIGYGKKFYIFHNAVISAQRLAFKERQAAFSELNMKKILHSTEGIRLFKSTIRKQNNGLKVSDEQIRELLKEYFPLPQGIRRMYSKKNKKNKENNNIQGAEK